MSDVASVVERYYATVADFDGRPEARIALLNPELRVVEHPLPAGAALEAHIAAMITVNGGLIREHETFDCQEPLPAASDRCASAER